MSETGETLDRAKSEETTMSTNASSFSRATYIIMVLSCPLLVQAGNFAGGTGRTDDPYRIATAEQLISAGATWTGSHFILLNDIDLDPNLPGGRVFEGAIIASGASPWRDPFRGNFDGGGHTIRNLVIRAKSQSDPSLTSAGLFGRIDQGAVVKDVGIEAADVQALDRRAGILAGENAGRIINCQVSGRVSSNGSVVGFSLNESGGLVGRNMGNISNCRADTDCVQGDGCAGGLVGANFPEGSIVSCRAVCNNVCARRFAGGGLVGTNSGYVIGSAALGGILAPDSSQMQGGLAGTNRGTILNCYAGSDLAAGARCSQLGGLVGENQGTIINCSASGSVSTQDRCALVGGLVGWNLFSQARVVNSYAVGKISNGTNNSEAGGLVGGNRDGDVKTSFWDRETSGMAVSAGGEGLTTAQMQQATPFLEAGWDFVDERTNGVTNAWRTPEGGGYPALTLGFDRYDPPRLAGEGTVADPYRIGTPDDLGIMWRHDPSAYYQLVADIDLAGIRWLGAPIATFSGTFNGSGFVISHLTLHESRMAGLFGFLGRNPLVMDLGIADANIVAPDEAHDLGVLAGRSYYETDVTRCYATGRLSAGRRSVALGGLIGWNQGSVADCYTRTDLSCGEESCHVGGLVGYDKGTIQRSYAARAVVAVDPNATCGSLLGTTATTITKVMMIACYFLDPSEGGGPNNGLGVPLTDTRMKQQTSFLNWDFKKTWKICEGKDYPRLWWEIIDCSQP
jgi:hypothetical protein